VQRSKILFDHLIGTGLQWLWHGQTARFSRLEIDGGFVLGGSLNRKIGELLTSKNAIDSRAAASLSTLAFRASSILRLLKPMAG
jgi:hypothetical protein